MNIATVKIDEIKPYWRNPRKSDDTVEALKDSIERYGYNVPIVVDAEGVILAGHARYRALVQLGYTEVRIVQVDLDEEKSRQFRVADNKSGEFSEWDMDSLKAELASMGVGSIENISDFFNGEEWADMMDISAFSTPPETAQERLEGQVPFGGAKGAEERGGATEADVELLCPSCLEDNTFTMEEFRGLVAKARQLREQGNSDDDAEQVGKAEEEEDVVVAEG